MTIVRWCACFIVLFAGLEAQPSGGTYGPVRQTYTVPNTGGSVLYVSPEGKKEWSGATVKEPTTLASAMENVRSGDVIILRGGTYRTGNLMLNQGIVMQPYKDEQPVLKGTKVATQWTDLKNGHWKTTWTTLFPASPDPWWNRAKNIALTPLHIFNNDMVFVDGRFLSAVGEEKDLTENSYYIDYAAHEVYLGTDPSKKLVEITAYDVALHRVTGLVRGTPSDNKGPVIRGITFTQYAYRAIEVDGKEPDAVMGESGYGKDVVGTTLENCSITFCSRVAAYLRGDHLTVRNCLVSETSTEGLYIMASSDVLLEHNIFSRNNIERITGYYPAAVKVFNQSHRVICRDNLITDLPYSNGIWYDVGERDGIFVRNRVEKVGNNRRTLDPNRPWPSESGFFFEISSGAVCAGNTFTDCDQGIFILNSAAVQVYNNTFRNSVATFGRNARTPANDGTFGWHSSTGPDVEQREGHAFVNNILEADSSFHRPLLFVWQPDSLCARLPNSMLQQCDANSFVRSASNATDPLVWWSPFANAGCQGRLYTLDPLKAIGSMSFTGNRSSNDAAGLAKPVPNAGQYHTVGQDQGTDAGAPIPARIRILMGIDQDIRFRGAVTPR